MGRIISAAATGLVLQCFVLLGSAPSALAQSAVQNTTNTGATLWVTTTQRIKSKIYENARLSQHPIVVVVVHGDSSDGTPPTYQYRFAERAAAAISDTVVAAVLRPGYSDGEDTSDGLRGLTTGDNWTPEIVNAVATVLVELKKRAVASTCFGIWIKRLHVALIQTRHLFDRDLFSGEFCADGCRKNSCVARIGFGMHAKHAMSIFCQGEWGREKGQKQTREKQFHSRLIKLDLQSAV